MKGKKRFVRYIRKKQRRLWEPMLSDSAMMQFCSTTGDDPHRAQLGPVLRPVLKSITRGKTAVKPWRRKHLRSLYAWMNEERKLKKMAMFGSAYGGSFDAYDMVTVQPMTGRMRKSPKWKSFKSASPPPNVIYDRRITVRRPKWPIEHVKPSVMKPVKDWAIRGAKADALIVEEFPSIPMDIGKALANYTKTAEADWESTEGPDSRCGQDYYYKNTKTGQEAYVNIDQGHITIAIDGEGVYDGPMNSDEQT